MTMAFSDITTPANVSYALQQRNYAKLDEVKAFDVNEAKAAAEDFEAFFVSRMLESMFEGVSTEGMFGGGPAEKVYRSMLFDEYGKVMAKSGSIGVSDQVMQSMIAVQEMQTQGFINPVSTEVRK